MSPTKRDAGKRSHAVSEASPSTPTGVATKSRKSPVQSRGAQRLDQLLDAAAAILDERGLDGLSTGLIAQRTGSSIGSVYRYFADRQGIYRALAQRNMDRYTARLTAVVLPNAHDYLSAIDGAITAFCAMFRDEPGFRELRFGDILDERLLSGGSSNNDGLAEAFTQFAVEFYSMQDVPDLTFHLSVAIEIADALLTRAFLTDPHGDPRYITVCRTVVREYLEAHLVVG